MRYDTERPLVVEVWMQVADFQALRKARRESGLSLRELASICKTSHATIDNLEDGRQRSVKPALARKLERVLRLEPETVFVERMVVVTPEVSTVAENRGRVA